MVEDKCKDCYAHQYEKRYGDMCIAAVCIKEYDFDPETRSYIKKVKPKKGGCYQFTYCNECLAFPMGLGCENKNKEEYKNVGNKEN